MLWKVALGRVRQNPRDHLFGSEAGHRRSLSKALFSQRGLMVDEIPVLPADEADVRLQDEHSAAGLEQSEGDAQLLEDCLRRGEVLEVVAEKRQVEAVGWHHVREL